MENLDLCPIIVVETKIKKVKEEIG